MNGDLMYPNSGASSGEFYHIRRIRAKAESGMESLYGARGRTGWFLPTDGVVIDSSRHGSSCQEPQDTGARRTRGDDSPTTVVACSRGAWGSRACG